MTGKLQYVVHSRLDIALSVGIIAIFFANPKENCVMIVKRMLKYLKGTKNYRLYYKKNDKFELKVYTDVDQAGNVDDIKSTSGGAFILGKRLVSWTSKKQNCHSQSTLEAKYVAAADNCSNIVWIKQVLKGMKEKIIGPIVIFCDNTSVINISKNHVMHIKTKHSAIKYYYLRELVQDKEVRLEYVNTKGKIANIFAKPLPKDAHEYLRGKLEVILLDEAT